MPHAFAGFVLVCAAGWIMLIRAHHHVRPGERLMLLAASAFVPAAAHVLIAADGRAADPAFVVPVMLAAYAIALAFIIAALCRTIARPPGRIAMILLAVFWLSLAAAGGAATQSSAATLLLIVALVAVSAGTALLLGPFLSAARMEHPVRRAMLNRDATILVLLWSPLGVVLLLSPAGLSLIGTGGALQGLTIASVIACGLFPLLATRGTTSLTAVAAAGSERGDLLTVAKRAVAANAPRPTIAAPPAASQPKRRTALVFDTGDIAAAPPVATSPQPFAPHEPAAPPEPAQETALADQPGATDPARSKPVREDELVEVLAVAVAIFCIDRPPRVIRRASSD